MNIVCAISSLGGGGAERVMAWLVTKLHAAGHTLTVVTRQPETEDTYSVPAGISRCVQPPYVNILRKTVLTDPYNYTRWTRHLRSVCREAKPDVVLSFIDDMNLFCLLALTATGVPVVVSERTDPRHSSITEFRKRLRPYVYRSAAAIVVQTPAIASYVARSWRLEQTVVIPNPVRPGVVRVENATLENRQVVSVGRLHSSKGHDVLLDAWSRLGERRVGWTLDIIGEGVERARLSAMIDRLGIRSSVHLRGHAHDVTADLSRASIFVLASRFEGFSNAVLEAMATGCAVIASDCSGANSALIDPGTNGELVPVDDPSALADALERLMADPALRRRYGAAARSRSADFAEDGVYSLWERTLRDAADRNPVVAPAFRHARARAESIQ